MCENFALSGTIAHVNTVIDTNILVDLAQTREDAAQELARYETLFISRITWIEFLVGAQVLEERRRRESLLKDLEILEIDAAICEETILIRQRTKLKLPDAIILATARVHGLLLVTRNSRDFSRKDPTIRIPY